MISAGPGGGINAPGQLLYPLGDGLGRKQRTGGRIVQPKTERVQYGFSSHGRITCGTAPI